ncbi:o-succinylbenzoate--CoA ligase [Streptoalloteichus hindustanus]|uniref:o-succinylbenzoate--CoA ligase n=1 Tax=Streptoalloteichus hindustanus TaxID=2017 RepID=UPI00389A242F
MRPLPVPTGGGALLLPPLRRALAGEGPAVLPVPADDPVTAERLVAALCAGPLTPAEHGADAADGPTALVVATSGSTGEPKGVLLPAGALRASAEATHARLGGPGHWLLALPAWSVAGTQVLVRSLTAETEPVVMDTSGGFRPPGFAEAAAPLLARAGRHYTSLVPTQLARLLAEGGSGLAALRAFDAVLLGGAATPPALLDRAESAGVRVVTTYGMSETSGGCVYDGVPLDGVRVRLADGAGGSAADGAAAPDGRVGRIELGGPVVARGYRGRADLTAAAFGDPRDGWFRTSDLGRRGVNGRWEVLGRVDDLVNTGGVKVAPILVERVLAAQPGVLEACVVGVPDPEWGQAVAAAVVPVDPAAPPSADALRGTVREQVGRAATPKRVTFVRALPLRGPGKVDRTAVRTLFAPSK